MSHRQPPEPPLPVAVLKRAIDLAAPEALGPCNETAVSTTIPLQIALHPASKTPPTRESLIVMIQYERGDMAFADICDYSDGKFLDMNGDEIPGEVLAWGLAPMMVPEDVESLREWGDR